MGQNTAIRTRERSAVTLSMLSDKQREVLDLVLEHKSSKEIARTLQISPYTVDQRVAAARQKLGVSTRGELARIYSRLLGVSERTAYDFSYVETDDFPPQELSRDQGTDPVFMLSDAGSIPIDLPWHLQPDQPSGLEAFDKRFGIFGRVLIIPALAVLLALLALAMTAIAMILPAVF